MHTAPAASAFETNPSSEDLVERELDAIKQLIPLGEVRSLIPSSRPGKATHISTLIRWVQRGVRAPDGRRVKLRAVRLGWAWMTTRAWVAQFVASISASNESGETPSISAASTVSMRRQRTPAERKRAVERAQAELRQLGVGA